MNPSQDKERGRNYPALLASVLSGGLGLAFVIVAFVASGTTVKQRWFWVLGAMLMLIVVLHFCTWDNLRILVRAVRVTGMRMRPKKRFLYQVGRMSERDEID